MHFFINQQKYINFKQILYKCFERFEIYVSKPKRFFVKDSPFCPIPLIDTESINHMRENFETYAQSALKRAHEKKEEKDRSENARKEADERVRRVKQWVPWGGVGAALLLTMLIIL